MNGRASFVRQLRRETEAKPPCWTDPADRPPGQRVRSAGKNSSAWLHDADGTIESRRFLAAAVHSCA